jgi:hypothetical protein
VARALPFVIISISNVKIAIVFTALSPAHILSRKNICSFLVRYIGVLVPRYAQQRCYLRGKPKIIYGSARAAPPASRLDPYLYQKRRCVVTLNAVDIRGRAEGWRRFRQLLVLTLNK